MNAATPLDSRPTIAARATAASRREPCRILVPANTPHYWIDALHRCGLFVSRGDGAVGAVGEVGAAHAVVAFVPPDAAVADSEIRALHRAGLAIVGDGRVARALGGLPVETLRGHGIRGTGPLFAGCPEIRMPGAMLVTASRVTIITPAGRPPVIALPLPSASALLTAPPALHGFPIRDDVEVHEIVSGCDHGGVRRLLRNALRLAHHLQGETFAALHERPSGFSGVLGIRIDADDFDPAATARVVDGLDRADLRATWFIDVERHEQKQGAGAVARLAARGDEVESHFYHHYTYRSAERNRRNLQRSRAVLREWGIVSRAAATPFGSFHAGVQAALRAAGSEWSSEFSAHYDDLPTTAHGSVQVPVHPVCPILLLEAGLGVDAVHKYYTDRLRSHLDAGETTIFYGHPIRDLGAVPELFSALRATLVAHATRTGLPVWQPTLGEFKTFHDLRRKLLLDGRLGSAAPPIRLDRSPHGASATPCDPSTCDTWRPRSPRKLARSQREIRFRRWLREFRNRTEI